jgi:RNA polymerase sigma factor (sigma-70 family)
MPTYSDEEIVAGIKNQNRNIQEHLYKTYYSVFLKVCSRYAKNMQDAEQLLNDGFLKIFNSIGQYNFSGSLKGWMQKIIVNTCLDFLRTSYVKNEKNVTKELAPSVEEEVSISNTAIQSMEFKELVTLIQSLPVVTKIVFNLYVFEGYNHKEIAGFINLTEGSSAWHLHQARSLLRKKININKQNSSVYETGRI